MDEIQKIAQELMKNSEIIKKRLLEVNADKKVIKFYSTTGYYGQFSNFSKYPIRMDNKIWPTSEHYFQAQKFAGTDFEEQIRMAESPFEAAQMGRDRTWPLREDWEERKVDIMMRALEAKFTQHSDLKELLLSTADCTLIEHTKNDSYWGDSGDGTGENRLGKALMAIRRKLGGDKNVFILPPWVAFPNEHPFSMFWRMGKGEDYLMYYSEWKETLSDLSKEQYDGYFKPAQEWEFDDKLS